MNELATTGKGFSLTPQSLDEALRFCEILAKSSIVPKDYIGNAGNILVAIQWGMELGLQPMQSMQNLAIINGRPSLWGDAVLAIVLASPVCEDVVEFYEGTPGQDNYTAVCIAKRKGKEDKVGRFSIADARAAGLLDKAGPWKQYRDRMMKMRARSFAIRDQFADVLKGMAIAEEVMDTPTERDMGGAQVVRPTEQAAPQTYPQENFDKNFPAWKGAIESGKHTPDSVIAMIESKAPLTEAQRTAILELKVPALTGEAGEQ